MAESMAQLQITKVVGPEFAKNATHLGEKCGAAIFFLIAPTFESGRRFLFPRAFRNQLFACVKELDSHGHSKFASSGKFWPNAVRVSRFEKPENKRRAGGFN